MKLKSRYKQTEVGAIPNDWDVKLLPDVCRFRSGKAHEQYISESGEYVCVNSKFISTDGQVRKYSSVNFCPAYQDDILMVMSDLPNGRALAKAYLVKEGQKYAVNQRVCALTPLRGNIAGYLYYTLNRNPYFLKFDDGVSQTHLLNPVFKKCPVAIPQSPDEQSAIAGALSDMDALLSSLDALIAKKRDLKHASMQQLLTGETRLPGFSSEWEMKRLDQLASIRSGGTPSTSIGRFWDGDIPWCTPTDITQLNGGKYLSKTSRTITREGLLNSSAELIPTNSVVMTSRATIGECAINSIPISTNQGFKNFVPYASTNVEFLYYLLQTQKQGFIRLCAGSTFLEISKTQLAAHEVPLPSSKKEQAAIAKALSDMDAELATLEARRDKTHALKQGMMQELLTGKTRLV
ncbi:restriction endonuclease subunit S [Dyella psychrodurans]|uniref:Restriction endonuclease subunit S n=1 Tax=Dyella psychrodurans TaxID=1927960 RepID=A0A370X755_9GAMM|nr:restriction endonuclease subunit S [Dyella psychrodurans]RDS84208.1 restriction endonuclease subunit S [Dyella psychrodurans]